VERKLYFYRVDIGHDVGGLPIPFEPRPVLAKIDKKDFTEAPKGRYFAYSDGNLMCCWVDQLEAPQRVRLGGIRRSDLPLMEEGGNIKDLPIPLTSGLVEQTHVVFFPNNVVGCVFNFHGPRVSQLGRYLQSMAPSMFDQVSIAPLLRQDVLEQFDRLGDIRMFRLKVSRSYIDTVRLADEDLGSAFEAAAKAGNAEDVEIVLRPPPYSRESLGDKLLQPIRWLLTRNATREHVTRFKINGLDMESGRTKEIDLLSDHLVQKCRIIRTGERSRALDRRSAYKALEAAYEDMKSEIVAAAAVSLT
jgi:hypothetical protein